MNGFGQTLNRFRPRVILVKSKRNDPYAKTKNLIDPCLLNIWICTQIASIAQLPSLVNWVTEMSIRYVSGVIMENNILSELDDEILSSA